MRRSFPDLHTIIVVGIAGGCPNPADNYGDLFVGDVVVSVGVLEHDFQKVSNLETGDIELRESGLRPPKDVITSVQSLDAERTTLPWWGHLKRSRVEFARPPELTALLETPDGATLTPEDRLANRRDRRPGEPQLHTGRVASGNSLLKDPKLRDQLRREHHVLAVEMEVAGVAAGAPSRTVEYLTVRGICDYCDKHKSDVWHLYAAGAAAAIVRSYLGIQSRPARPDKQPRTLRDLMEQAATPQAAFRDARDVYGQDHSVVHLEKRMTVEIDRSGSATIEVAFVAVNIQEGPLVRVFGEIWFERQQRDIGLIAGWDKAGAPGIEELRSYGNWRSFAVVFPQAVAPLTEIHYSYTYRTRQQFADHRYWEGRVTAPTQRLATEVRHSRGVPFRSTRVTIQAREGGRTAISDPR